MPDDCIYIFGSNLNPVFPFGDETLKVAVGRVVGFRRMMRLQRVGELVPGLAMLLPVTAFGRRRPFGAR